MTDSAALPQFSTLAAFDHQPRTRLVFGVNCLERLGELAREVGAQKILLVTDPGIAAAGHVERALQHLHAARLTAVVFDRAIENPTTASVDECLSVARGERIDAFVALGGGSSMDTAKGCNFLLTNGGHMRDYRRHRQRVPIICFDR